MAKICLTEDEKDLNKILELYLKKAGHDVVCCYTMTDVINQIDLNNNFDLWVIDIMLPDGNGIEILKKIKEINPEITVILISARGDSIDRVLGFEVVCDDYIAKPFLPAELVHRVSKVLKFCQNNIKKGDYNILNFGPYTIYNTKRMVFENDVRIDLTSREYDIVCYFIKNSSIAISRDTLMKEIWNDECYGYDRVVDNYIKNIRKKLPYLNIETVYGYRCNL